MVLKSLAKRGSLILHFRRTIVAALTMLFCMTSAFASIREAFVFTDVQSDAQNDIYFDSMAASGGSIYLHDYNNGCVWRAEPDAKKITAFPEIISQEDTAYTSISALASRSDSLYALASSYQRDASGISYLGSGLYELMPGNSAIEQKLICTLDLSAYVTTLEGWGDELSSCTMVLHEDALFCLFHSNGVLLQISRIDQSIRKVNVENPIYLAEYESDQLLISCQNPDGTQRLVTYDPLEDAVEDLVDGVYSSVSGFIYRESDHMLYAVSEGSVYRIDPRADQAKAEQCGTLGHYDPIIGGADGNDRLIWYSASEAMAVHMDAEARESRALTYSVIGSFSSDALEGFARTQGNLSMKSISRTDREIIEDMLTQRDEVDVYIFNITEAGVYRSLYQRGYLKPLDSEIISEKLGEMYPFLQNLAMQDGVAVALPISMVLPVNQLGINRELCTRLGLDVPDNWPAFLSCLESGLAQADSYLFSQQDAQALERGLFSLLMSAYSAAMNSGAGPACYHTPELVALLQRLQALDYERLVQSAAPDGQDSAKILFALDVPDSCCVQAGDYEPLPLPISAGQPAYVYASITLMCINPYSQNQELALEFLEYTLENLSPLSGAQLFETATAPIEDADYAALKREYEQQIARQEAMIEAADGVDQAVLREELDHYIERNEPMLADAQYIVTQQSLDAFRARLDTYVPYYNEGLSEEASDRLSTANARYFEGNLTIEQYLQELDRQITMRAMEDEGLM